MSHRNLWRPSPSLRPYTKSPFHFTVYHHVQQYRKISCYLIEKRTKQCMHLTLRKGYTYPTCHVTTCRNSCSTWPKESKFIFYQGNVHDGKLWSKKCWTPTESEHNPSATQHNRAKPTATRMAERQRHKQCHKQTSKMWHPRLSFRCRCNFQKQYIIFLITLVHKVT